MQTIMMYDLVKGSGVVSVRVVSVADYIVADSSPPSSKNRRLTPDYRARSIALEPS